ncbi:hypothetical protein BCR39DRAFT_514155 [Naematelia encephala]|uniref:Secreted protein n=1 Tax=Naematelia encephala TaxID=71784 RepID=A0A1Y2BIV7_9TREE|nr:hypothetical protein BCR39DRAFT_514155 [Naematelia encephala]
MMTFPLHDLMLVVTSCMVSLCVSASQADLSQIRFTTIAHSVGNILPPTRSGTVIRHFVCCI